MRAEDTLHAGPAMSWLVLRIALVVIVAGGCAILVPPVGWYIVAVVLAICAAIIPRSLATWGSVACIVVGMALSAPDLGRAMLAVLVVHLIHVLGSLTLIAPPGTLITLAALRPTAVRFGVVQVVAQPLTFVVMLGGGRAPELPWAVVVGGGALVAAAAVLIVRLARGQE